MKNNNDSEIVYTPEEFCAKLNKALSGKFSPLEEAWPRILKERARQKKN